MKKLRLIPVFTQQKHFLQFILFMKLFITFLLLNTFSLYAIDTYSQSTRVSMHFNKVKISEILNDIETKTDYLFFYNHKDIKSDTKVSINVENKPISAILDEIFQNTDVKYSMLNNHIVLFTDNATDKNMKSQSSEQTSIRVTGTVRDTNGEPLVGANISVKNTTIGTITDIDGNYSIDVPDEQSVLLFSMIGFIPQEIKAGDRKKLSSVTLQEDLQLLDEVVVVGYTTIKAKRVTGAISDIRNKELMQSTATKTTSALMGKMAGVATRQASGGPGAGANIEIRNLGTPLFIIDGIQKDQGQFDNLDPTDIESVTVLKDASASIYGIQASNGVIVVTTKGGAYKTSNTLNISYRHGWQNFTQFPEMMNAAQWVDMRVEQDMNLYGQTSWTREEYDKWQAGTEPGYQSFDWKKFIVRKNAPQSHFNINSSGGSDKTKYYLSFSITNQDGMFDSSDFSRYNIQSNVESEIVKGLKVGMNINGRIEQFKSVATTVDRDDQYIFSEAIFRNRPTERPYANDNPLYPADNGSRGYVNTAVYTGANANPGHLTDKWRIIQGNMKLSYDFSSIKALYGLTATALASYYYADNTYERQQKDFKLYTYDKNTDTYTHTGGSYDKKKKNSFNSVEELMFRIQLNYIREFNKHAINAFVVGEATERKNPTFSVDSKPTSNSLPLVRSSEFTNLGNGYSETSRAGFLGMVNYVFDDKYIIEVSGRYDGSYKFAKGNRWGFFPSVLMAYRIGNEKFWKDAAWGKTINDLKFRASYGKMGDDNIEAFLFFDGYNAYNGSYVMEDNKVTIGFAPRKMPSTTLSWIKTSLFNVGVDFGLFNSKITGSFDYFIRKRDGLPASKNDIVLPSEVGFDMPMYNLNGDKNIGWDASLKYNGSYKDLSYQIGGNVSFSRRKTTKVYNPIFSTSLNYYRDNTANRWEGGFWGYESAGQFTSQEQIDNWKIDNDGKGNRTMRPGDIIYKDLNNDGRITDLDMRKIGYSGGLPLLNYGISINANWKGFDINMLWQGAGKYQYYREWEVQKPAPGDGNSAAMFADRWHREDPFDLNSAWIPGKYPSTGSWASGQNNNYDRASDFWLTNIVYLRLKELELGYTIPQQISLKAGIKRFRVYFSGTNLITFDNIDIVDPEIDIANGVTYPPTKLVSIGFNATF